MRLSDCQVQAIRDRVQELREDIKDCEFKYGECAESGDERARAQYSLLVKSYEVNTSILKRCGRLNG